jgi:hypothetical protein
LIGIITAIVGNILISFALNIQRYAHIRLHEERAQRKEKLKNNGKSLQNGYGSIGTNGSNGHHVREVDGENGAEEGNPLQSSFHSASSQSTTESRRDEPQDSSYLRSPYWWGGIVLMTVGEAGNFLAYGFAPASIVSPLGVVALISNCVIAPFMLKERFRIRDFWGVVVAVGGAVVVVLSAKQEEKKLGPHEIWGAITTTEFEIYMAVTAVLIGVLMWASPRYGNRTILIDLGLVGLFGMLNDVNSFWLMLTSNRRIHCSFDERCSIDALIDPLESSHYPGHICPRGCLGRYRNNAGEICQQSTPALQFYAGHSDSICHVHLVSDHWKRSIVSGFRKGYSRYGWEVHWGVCTYVFWSFSYYKRTTIT